MSALATPVQRPGLDAALSEGFHQFREFIVSDLPGDVTGRLKRRQYVIDLLKLDSARDAAELAAQFANEDVANILDAPTAGEWIRHNCKTTRSVAYDSVNVGEQLPRLPQCERALVEGEIGFAHLSVIARTADALSEKAPNAFNETDVLAKARESSAGRLWHYCMRLRHALDPEGVEHEQRIAVEERRLQFSVWEDGSVLISGQLDPVGGAALRTALEPLKVAFEAISKANGSKKAQEWGHQSEYWALNDELSDLCIRETNLVDSMIKLQPKTPAGIETNERATGVRRPRNTAQSPHLSKNRLARRR